jgi:hypothetical protein
MYILLTTYMLYRIFDTETLVVWDLGLGSSHLHLTIQGQTDTGKIVFSCHSELEFLHTSCKNILGLNK